LKEKRKISKGPFLIAVAVVVVVILVLLFVQRMEGRPPTLKLHLSSAALGSNGAVAVDVADPKSGLRKLWISILHKGGETILLDKVYPSAGIFSGGQVHEDKVSITVDPASEGIEDGKAMLRVMASDYSWRRLFKGNSFYQEQEIIIDTRPPEIEVISKDHYLSQGGAGLVIYKLPEQCPTSGVQVGDYFYPGYNGHFSDTKLYMAFIAVAHDQPTTTSVSVIARDYAGNTARSGLRCLINARRFKDDTLRISDGFLGWKMPEFRDQVAAGPDASDLEVYLKVNGDLRAANYKVIQDVTSQCERQVHWQGAFLRLRGAAKRGGFADRRTYVYSGKKVDRQIHLGIDLASLKNAKVPAANGGKVVMADTLGIYGKTVMIDHGFGLFSMYAHLSHIGVTNGQSVGRGDTIGETGTSGLAGGDHLHFSMLVHSTFVNPVEWWDAKWIENNVESKVASVQSF
jgi:murein DD-endopeptidase MepM/ murein hydrolase activator NlpD